jgi:hypothetical protein
MTPYQFALLRYVHDGTAGEFVNVGVVLFDAESRRLLLEISNRYGRASKFFRPFNGTAYRAMLRQVERTLREAESELREPDMLEPSPHDLAAILQRILPEEENAFHFSEIMSGISEDVSQRAAELYKEFIQRYEVVEEIGRRDEEEMRRDIDRRIVGTGLEHKIDFGYLIAAAHLSHEFHAGWKNGKIQVFEPISFDLLEARSIVDKASDWTGRLYNLTKGGQDFGFSALVAPPSDPHAERCFRSRARHSSRSAGREKNHSRTRPRRPNRPDTQRRGAAASR